MSRRNTHHIWWPRRDYKTPLERKFRQLPCNTMELDVVIHAMLHQYTAAPQKPSHEAMATAVNQHKLGHCGCERGE